VYAQGGSTNRVQSFRPCVSQAASSNSADMSTTEPCWPHDQNSGVRLVFPQSRRSGEVIAEKPGARTDKQQVRFGDQ
jgi:hypothetical protein